MPNAQIVVVTVIGLMLLGGLTGVAAAQPSDGPPEDLPGPVPDFVSDLLGAISDFVIGTISVLGDALRSITPNTVAT